MLIVVSNNKGGQGKTFIATLLTLYLASNPKNKDRITCCDLDRSQRNFSDSVSLLNLPVTLSLPPKEEYKKMFWIVDTPPNIREGTDIVRQAIIYADLLVVPVILSKYSVQGVNRVAETRGKKDMKIILNDWNGTLIEKKAEEYLREEGFNIIGKLSRNRRVSRNLEALDRWDSGLQKAQAAKIITILASIFK
jgi:cellulose biosynthesis protein BcsQ